MRTRTTHLCNGATRRNCDVERLAHGWRRAVRVDDPREQQLALVNVDDVNDVLRVAHARRSEGEAQLVRDARLETHRGAAR